MGRLAALSHFLAKSAENCLPFFAMLRGASPLRWTEECQQAFESLKEHLSKLAALATPPLGKGLLFFLSASPAAVSAVMVLEDNSGSKPLYYVSEALAGPKIAYALVMAYRKLRHYFLAHDITVPTSYPLGDMFWNGEATGRIGKWAVEIASFTICFVAQSTINSLVLADFVVEWTRHCTEQSKPPRRRSGQRALTEPATCLGLVQPR